jgi:diaminopimelate decarboxylase
VTEYAELAERFGTPLYVYDLDRVAAARDSMFAALPDGFELFYAIKANPHPDVSGTLREDMNVRHACRAEISSVGELSAALAAGFRASECLYTGPGKTRAELAEAIARGVRMFSVESVSDLRRIGAVAESHGASVDCLIRVNDATAAAPSALRMTGKPSQFGIDSETLAATMQDLLSVPGARVIGAHFFTRSNAASEDDLIDEFEHIVELSARLQREIGLPLEFLDIGGGFAAPYATPGKRPTYHRLPDRLEYILDMHLPNWRLGVPTPACESGRYLVGDSGFLLCGVVNVKESRGRRFVILDAGINAIGGLSGLGRLLPAPVRPASQDRSQTGSLVGPLCTPGDVLARDIDLPELKPGDVLTVPNAGAYGLTASLSGFLGRPMPTEVTVRGGEIVSASRLEHHRAYEAFGVAGP